MKTNKISRSTIRKIHSMHELQLEKARLKMDLLQTEGKIRSTYRQILSAFAFRNILTTLTTEFAGGTTILSKIVSLGKNWITKRKKKKKQKQAGVAERNTDEKVRGGNEE